MLLFYALEKMWNPQHSGLLAHVNLVVDFLGQTVEGRDKQTDKDRETNTESYRETETEGKEREKRESTWHAQNYPLDRLKVYEHSNTVSTTELLHLF